VVIEDKTAAKQIRLIHELDEEGKTDHFQVD
jgi:hypothetical protein